MATKYFSFNRTAAKKAGWSDEDIDKYLEEERSKGNNINVIGDTPTPSQASTSEGRSLLAGALPILGGIAGGIAGAPLGPAGIIAGGAFGSGLGQAGSELIDEEEGFNTGRVVKETALGGIGGVGGLALTKVLRLGGKVAPKIASTLDEGVAKPKVVASPFAAADEKEITEVVSKIPGLSAKAKYANLEPEFKKLTGKITKKLTGKEVETAKVLSTFDDSITKGLANFDESIPAYETAKRKFTNQLLELANQGKGGGLKVTDKSLFEFKQKLSKQLGRAFDKIEKGTPLTPQEEVGLAMWSSIDDMMPRAVKELTRRQSLLYKAAPGLKTAKDAKYRIPILGTIPGLGRATQATETLGSRALRTNVSPLMGNLLGQTVGQPTARIAGNGGSPTAGTPAVEGGILRPEEDLLGLAPQQERSVTLQGNTVTESQMRQAIMELTLAGASKQAKALTDVYELAFPEVEGQDPLSVTGANAMSLAESGRRGLEEARVILEQDPGVLTKQLLPGKFASRQFDSAMFRTIEALLRARSGAAVPESEVRRYMSKYAPNFGDNQETIQFKLSQLEKDFEDIMRNIQSTRGGVTLESLAGSSY